VNKSHDITDAISVCVRNSIIQVFKVYADLAYIRKRLGFVSVLLGFMLLELTEEYRIWL